jgi:hypothetical protein
LILAWVEEYRADEACAYPAQVAIPTKWASEYLENLR